MSIVLRNGRYGVKRWDRGAKKYLWVGTFATRSEAQEAERRATPSKGELSVEQWGAIWLSDYSRPAGATRMVYRQAVNRVTAELGQLKLSEVDRRTARHHALDWPRNVSSVARTMWADAVRDGICRENPWTNMRLKQSRGRKDIRALTEAQVNELAEIAGDLSAVILTLGYVGIRPGEMCALRWDDLDLPNYEMRVCRSLDVTGVEKSPKNGLTRTVTVPPRAHEAIRLLPRMLDGYVFHSYRERRLTKANLFYLWRPVRDVWIAQGNEHLDLYSLRHAAATMLLERGVSAADVAVQLGHTDGGRLVQLTYGHPDEDRARDRIKMAWAETPSELRRAHG